MWETTRNAPLLFLFSAFIFASLGLLRSFSLLFRCERVCSRVNHVLLEAVAACKASQRHNLCDAHLFLLVEFPGPLEFSRIGV